MDDQSVVEYFERFAAHAFGDTSSVITTCVLVGPDGRSHPCSFCFTIKRDVFDIPMMGNPLCNEQTNVDSCREFPANLIMTYVVLLSVSL